MDDLAKKRIVICFTINGDFAKHLCVVVSSLLKNNPDSSFGVYVFHFGITPETEQKILTYYKHHTNLRMEFVAAEQSWVASFKVSGHASPVNYLRIHLPQLLPDVSKVLYLDADLVVRSQIAELFEYDIAQFPLAAVPSFNPDRSAILGILHENYFNSGVMLLNLDYWRNHNLTSRLVDFLVSNPDKIHYWDQDALNAILHDAYFKIDPKWNFTELTLTPPDLDSSDVRIVHFVGEQKPWNYYCQHPLRGEYFKYLQDTPWPSFEFEENKWSNKLKRRLRNLLRFW